MDPEENLNDRELLVRIDERVGSVQDGQNEMKQEVRDLREAQQDATVAQARCMTLQNTRWEGHGKEHEVMEQSIRRKSNIGDALALGVAALAAALNINFKH